MTVGGVWGAGGRQIRRWWKCPTPPISLDPQFFYHNFDHSNYDDDDIRTCAVLDLASLQWMPMQCEAQLDWICKLPKGTRQRGPLSPSALNNLSGDGLWDGGVGAGGPSVASLLKAAL